jgi:hypothetical protein
MTLDLIKLARIAETERLDLDFLRKKVLETSKDKTGSTSNSLAGTLRFLAVADYALGKNVALFRRELVEAVGLRSRLFARFDAGEPVSPSYVSMLSYKTLFSAMAAGDWALAKTFGAQMGGREAIERQYDRPFDVAMGYALKSVIAGDFTEATRHLDALDAACREPDNTDFKGHVVVLRAILNEDVATADEGFAELLLGHKRQCKGGGLFMDTEDEVLSVWGIGLANLARMRGLKVCPIDPLIPADLLG